MTEKILVVEDEVSLQETLVYNLEKQGYQVEIASDGLSALEKAHQFQPDLVILDIMMPGMDGFEVCRVLRQEMNTLVLMLTARDDEIDRVVGLEVGADDYMTKPFSMRELMARVKAMLRRLRLFRQELDEAAAGEQKGNLILKFGRLSIDSTRREVYIDDRLIPLKPKEYELLLYMAKHRGQVLSRGMVLERVWGWDYIGDSRTVDVHVRWLRKKIEADPAQPAYIITIRGAGYRFDG